MKVPLSTFGRRRHRWLFRCALFVLFPSEMNTKRFFMNRTNINLDIHPIQFRPGLNPGRSSAIRFDAREPLRHHHQSIGNPWASSSWSTCGTQRRIWDPASLNPAISNPRGHVRDALKLVSPRLTRAV